MNSGSFFEIIILAMVALFAVWKLRSVLGRRTGHERQRPNPFSRAEGQGRAGEAQADKVVTLPGRKPVEAGAEPPAADTTPGVSHGITQIRIADPSFDPGGFLNGARAAFGMIVAAFAEGDTATLRPLLSDDLYDEFSEAIRTRLAAGETLENHIDAIKSAELVDARVEGRTAFVVVRFVSSQVNVTRNADGEITDGDPEVAVDVTDLWTFARNTRAVDPNWTLVETDTPG